MVSIISIKSNKLSGEVFVPGDKSISHRALILGACAVGKTTIENLLESEDVLATLSALNELGVNIKKRKKYFAGNLFRIYWDNCRYLFTTFRGI